jgi:carboxyl-terminal processing protease
MAAAVALAYAGGVLTGVVGSHSTPAEHRSSGVIDEAADRIEAGAAKPVDRKQLEEAAVEGMLDLLGDKWSSYLRPSEFESFQEAMDGRYSGVGVWLRPGDDGHSVVVGSVQSGSPAAEAGIAAGDQIISIDGKQVADLSLSAVALLLRTTGDDSVEVIVRSHGTNRSLRLERTTFLTDDVILERLRGSVTRIHLLAFTRGVGKEVRQALQTDNSGSSGGIVLDLRDNPGGLLDEAVEVASAFLDGGPVVSYERRGQGPRTLDALGHGDTTTPVVVLVNGGTASAAEVVAAALQDRNRAVVIGSRTYGKGSVQEPTRLSDGSALELTVGRYLTPSGRSIDGVGVDPDVEVASDMPPEQAERRAIEVLSGLLASIEPSGRG